MIVKKYKVLSLKENDIIKKGDEFKHKNDFRWMPCDSSIGYTVKTAFDSEEFDVRRLIEIKKKNKTKTNSIKIKLSVIYC